MKFERFWKLVDEHPWLPRIIGGFWEAIQVIHVDPKFVATYFAPSVIARAISFICFQQWDRLDSTATTESRDVERKYEVEGGSKMTELVGHTIFYTCYWHKDGSQKFSHPFSGETSNYHESNLSVREMMDRVLIDGGVIDAVVRVYEFTHYKNGTTTEDFSEDDIKFISSGYCIFIPPDMSNRITKLL